MTHSGKRILRRSLCKHFGFCFLFNNKVKNFLHFCDRCTVYLLFKILDISVELSLFFSCAVFLVVNALSGKVFLGDMGSYGLGAILLFYGFYFHAQNIFSASFLAALFSYPCIEILSSIARRSYYGGPILLPDNDHLHNRVYEKLKPLTKSRILPNTLTGLLISGFSSGLVLVAYSQQIWMPSSNDWWILFAFQLLFYIVVYIISGLQRTSLKKQS